MLGINVAPPREARTGFSFKASCRCLNLVVASILQRPRSPVLSCRRRVCSNRLVTNLVKCGTSEIVIGETSEWVGAPLDLAQRRWQTAQREQAVKYGGGGGHRMFLRKMKAEGALKGRRRGKVFEGLSEAYFALPEDERRNLQARSYSKNGILKLSPSLGVIVRVANDLMGASIPDISGVCPQLGFGCSRPWAKGARFWFTRPHAIAGDPHDDPQPLREPQSAVV